MKRERVHGILWDWCLLRFRERPDERQDIVRTLHRLVSTPGDLISLLCLSNINTSLPVFSTILWSFYRHALEDDRVVVVEKALPVLQNILGHRSLSRRLLCCDMIRKLWRRGSIRACVVEALEDFVIGILRHHPRHERAVFVVTRYAMEVPSRCPIDPSFLLPCGGMAWVKAMEYICSQKHYQLSPRILGPLPSSHDTEHLVSLWPVDVQRFFVMIAKNSGFATLVGGRLLAVMSALSHLTKVPGEMGPIVPEVLQVLETLHQPHVTTDQKYDLWESAWRILERHHPQECDAPRMWKVLATFPDLSASWCREQIRTVLGRTGNVPDEFIIPLLKVLPQAFMVHDAERIAFLVTKNCCGATNALGQRFCWDVGCIDFCCAIDEKTHALFVKHHVPIFLEALGHVDARVRIRARRMLARVPDILFEASFLGLEAWIAQGDVSCTIAIQILSPERKRRFAPVLSRLVLENMNLYSDDGRPSIALVTFSGLPADVLRPKVEEVIRKLTDSEGGSTLPTIWDARIEDRLFLLGQMPAGVIARADAVRVADEYWNGATRKLAVRIVYNTKNAWVYDHFKHRCFELIVQGAGDDDVKHLALYVLTTLPCPALERLLSLHWGEMKGVSPTYTCKILELTSLEFLLSKADFIVNLCLDNLYLECCLDLLAKVPCLGRYCEKIVALAAKYEEEGVKWSSLRVVLKKIGEHDMVDEVLFTRAFV